MKKQTGIVTAQASEHLAPGETVDVRATAVALLQEARRLGTLAESEKDIRTAVLSIDKAARVLELVAKLQENRPERSELARSPEFISFRDRILAALAPFPDAKAAVMRALAPNSQESP